MAPRLPRWRPRTNERPAKGEGAYLQIYPSPLVNASRMTKIATSVHNAELFDETHLVGVHADGLEARTELAPGLVLNRFRGSARLGNLGRVLRLLLWQPRVFAHYWKAPVAVVAAHNVWVLPLSWLIARSRGATLVYNAHELETEAVAMKGLKQKAAQMIESRIITKCALVSVVNEPIANWYVDRYRIRRPVVVGNIPEVSEAEVGLRARLGISSSEMLYIHTGNITGARHIPLILSAFASTTHHLVFLGDGPLREHCADADRRHANIHWLKPVEPELVVAHIREADVSLCLIEQHLSLSYQLSSPNKLLESLAAGTPPLCSELAEARRLLGMVADRWILSDPVSQLVGAVNRIRKEDVAVFRASWPGIQQWSDEVVPLLDQLAAYGLKGGVQ